MSAPTYSAHTLLRAIIPELPDNAKRVTLYLQDYEVIQTDIECEVSNQVASVDEQVGR